MRFIIDESTGTAIVEFLRSNGHDVLSVAETMTQADDQTILIKAVSEDRILVTNDKDFAELIFRSGEVHQGVLLLRLHDESPSNRVHVVKAVLEQYADRLILAFTVATESSVRIRPGAK